MASPIDIKVWGEYACFTRPEFKVERVSYPVITPSAARGILEAIYWKPQFRYCIQSIGILKQGTQFALLRNEIKSRQSETPNSKSVEEYYVVAEEDRAQRTSLVLQNVCYRIIARIELRNGETNIGKHLDCFRRRAERGECYHRPYLGCREFAADFEASTYADEPDDTLNLSIGTMLFDTAYIKNSEWYHEHPEDRLEFWRHDGREPEEVKGYTKRLFFNAEVKDGWLNVPQEKYDELTQLEAGDGTA